MTEIPDFSNPEKNREFAEELKQQLHLDIDFASMDDDEVRTWLFSTWQALHAGE